MRYKVLLATGLLGFAMVNSERLINTLHAQTIERQISVDEQRGVARPQQPASFRSPLGSIPIPSPPATPMSDAQDQLSHPGEILRAPQAARDAVVLTSHTTPNSSSKYEPIPLRIGKQPQAERGKQRSPNSGRQAATTVFTSLTIVLAAFFLLVWIARRSAPRGLAPLPGEVVELLGRAPLAARQQMQLIRLGRKLVLLSVTPTGINTITEVTDSEEVDRLCSLCQRTRPESVTESLRQVLSQYASEPAPAGFVGDPSASQVNLANRVGRRSEFEESEDD